MKKQQKSNNNVIGIMDGNEAAAYVAYKTNEICVIYPITPASTMGELADQWAVNGVKNIWGTVPDVVEMQSEGGAAGAMHGSVQTGALATTFTSSQGLLLMIPNMYRIAAELTPTVFHVASRILAYQGMSIYCDHSDVMATRATGFAMLCSNNVQEVHDFALLAEVASLESRIPFLHFFDGFRTSHEVAKINLLSDEDMHAMLSMDAILAHRARQLTPNHPLVRGAIQNSDIAFQARESANSFYDSLPGILQNCMDRFTCITGRSYRLLDYYGALDAERIIIIMGSGAETVQETVDYLQEKGEKVAVIKVRLFRPFPKEQLINCVPKTCKAIAVLDRTKESGSSGEPLYQEVATTFLEAYNSGSISVGNLPKMIAGLYGIGSKEFTPAMVESIFLELGKIKPKINFTIGIIDDVTHTNLNYCPDFDIEPKQVVRAIFYGLGADGTVGANKNTIKIIGEETEQFTQAYFVYDAKKSGSKTISHLRFSPEPIHSAYLIQSANFIACHQSLFINQFNLLEKAAPNAVFLLNSVYGPKDIWQHLPQVTQETILQKNISFYVIDAYKTATEAGAGRHINTIMQTCFLALSNVLPKEIAIEKIKATIKKTYAKKGDAVVKKNFAAVDQALANLHQVVIPTCVTTELKLLPPLSVKGACCINENIQMITEMVAGRGDDLPVSAIPVDGSYDIGTTCLEKRNISFHVPVWDKDACIQCGQCSLVCPHSVLRVKHYPNGYLKHAPKGFKSATLRDKKIPEHAFTIQSYPEDCTGCGLCVEACPVKLEGGLKRSINLEPKSEALTVARENITFFEGLPTPDVNSIDPVTVRGVQYLPPAFEFCGACAGCGEAPYVRLLSQLYGDRLLIADACGCTLVYGCNLPTMPWTKDKNGRGPAFSGSLFEDNAEFGFGFALTADKHRAYALELLESLRNTIGNDLVEQTQKAAVNTKAEIQAQRERIDLIKAKLKNTQDASAVQLLSVIDYLVRPSIWALGGDGWAYDIGYGGLDHVIANKRKINILVLDTEVYSNTGGQSSKATPRGSVAKFAANGKSTAKKDLGMMAMSYGSVYVASIALGANPAQALKVFQEAESYPGPALIIAYSQCIAHGIEMRLGMQQQKLAVKSGYWLLYRYDPRRVEAGLNPLQLDSEAPSIPLKDYMYNENRFSILAQTDPEHAKQLLQSAEEDVQRRWAKYLALSQMKS